MKTDPLAQAKTFATYHHVSRKGQLYGPLPYTHHLAAVEGVVRRFVSDPSYLHTLLVASWLHDVVEDTDASIRDVEEQFGDQVAELVAAVTSEPGPNRKTRNALTYPKIREAGAIAVMLKLADRIANVEHGGGAVEMYRREHEDFKHGLDLKIGVWPGPINAMILHLDTILEIR